MENETNRHTQWFMSGAFGTIALVALLKTIGDVTDQEKEIKWAVSGISSALGLAGLAVLANLFVRNKFVGTPIEGSLAIMTLGMWAAVLPAIMDPSNNIATIEPYGTITNPNLYFFSWGGMLSSLYVLLHYLREKKGIDPTANKFPFGLWAMLASTSFVVMAAASRQFKHVECDTFNTVQCDRTKYATGLGVISGFVAVLMMAIGAWKPLPAMLRAVIDLLFLAAWTIEITITTFGADKAVTTTLGNLYFFSWMSFGVTCHMVSLSFYDLAGDFLPGSREPVEEEKQKEDVGDEEAAEPVKVADPKAEEAEEED